MSALSLAAQTAMQAAWSGQRMTSAYLAHHQALGRLDAQMVLAEQLVWLYWLDHADLPDTQHLRAMLAADDVAATISVQALPAWTLSENTRCSALFTLNLKTVPGLPHQARAASRVRWDICCDTRPECEPDNDSRRVRHWSRELWRTD